MRDAARIVRQRQRHPNVRGRERLGQHFVPAPECGEGEDVVGHHLLEHEYPARHVEIYFRFQCPRRLERLGTPSRHGRDEREEMNVVGIVGQRIDRDRLLALDERLVGVDRMDVARGRVAVSADSDINVGRHVHHVPHPGHQARQSLGAGHRLLRRHRLHGVDIVVTGAGMLRIPGDDPFQAPHDLVRLGYGFPSGVQ